MNTDFEHSDLCEWGTTSQLRKLHKDTWTVHRCLRSCDTVWQRWAVRQAGYDCRSFSFSHERRHLPAGPLTSPPPLPRLPPPPPPPPTVFPCVLPPLGRFGDAWSPDTCRASLHDQEAPEEAGGAEESLGRTWWGFWHERYSWFFKIKH